jgi:uncharacterized membrane protein
MKTKLLQEAVTITLPALPIVYLAFVDSALPETIPVHFNAGGNPDRMGSKSALWSMNLLLTVPLYFLFKYLPKLNPKKQLECMGNTFCILRLVLTVFISAIRTGITYTTVNYNNTQPMEPRRVFVLLGLLFIFLENFMQALKPNYFITMRTSWTLENEVVWRKADRLDAWAFMGIGLLKALSAVLFSKNVTSYTTMCTTFGIATVVVLYTI